MTSPKHHNFVIKVQKNAMESECPRKLFTILQDQFKVFMSLLGFCNCTATLLVAFLYLASGKVFLLYLALLLK